MSPDALGLLQCQRSASQFGPRTQHSTWPGDGLSVAEFGAWAAKCDKVLNLS